MGFDITVGGSFTTKSQAALIMTQGYLYNHKSYIGSTMSQVTGDVNSASLEAVKAAANKGLKYSTMQSSEWPLTPALYNNEDPEHKIMNGYIDDSDENLVYVGRINYLERNTAIAWARMVLAATEAGYDAELFSARYERTSGNRSYYMQCEAYIDERAKGGNDASNPYFTKGVSDIYNAPRSTNTDCKNIYAENWYNRHNNNDPSDGIDFDLDDGTWDNFNDVGENPTVPGGDWQGYGGSPHGWGIGFDMSFGDVKTGPATKPVIKDFMERYAKEYGFTPFLDEKTPKVFVGGKEVNNYAETWHWNYRPDRI